MPCSYTIHKDRRLVVTTASDLFSFAEGIAHEDQLYRDPDFDPTYAHLIDATPVTETVLTSSELASLARRTKFATRSRRALVARSPVVFGLGRMFEAYLQLSGLAEFVGHLQRNGQSAGMAWRHGYSVRIVLPLTLRFAASRSIRRYFRSKSIPAAHAHDRRNHLSRSHCQHAGRRHGDRMKPKHHDGMGFARAVHPRKPQQDPSPG